MSFMLAVVIEENVVIGSRVQVEGLGDDDLARLVIEKREP